MYSLQIGKNARNALFSVCVYVCMWKLATLATVSSLNNMRHTLIICRSKDNADFFNAKNNPRQGFKKERIATLFASNSLSLHKKYFRI